MPNSKKYSICLVVPCAAYAWQSENEFTRRSFHQNTWKNSLHALVHSRWAIIFPHVAKACRGSTLKRSAQHLLVDAATPSTSYAPSMPSATLSLPAHYLFI